MSKRRPKGEGSISQRSDGRWQASFVVEIDDELRREDRDMSGRTDDWARVGLAAKYPQIPRVTEGGDFATDVHVIETARGFTESFNRHQIEVLERLGLIRHLRDDCIIHDAEGRGVGPLHRFYGPAS